MPIICGDFVIAIGLTMPCRVFVLGSPADMMKAVNSALNANYSGKAWLKWFTTTAKAIIAELDASSATDGVRCSTKFELY